MDARFKAARDVNRPSVHVLPDPGADLLRLKPVPGVDLTRLEAVAPVALVIVIAPEDVPQDAPVVVTPKYVLQAVPASDAHFSSGSPLPMATAELPLLAITLVTKVKHLSDGHSVLDVGDWFTGGGILAAALPPGVTRDGNNVAKNGTF